MLDTGTMVTIGVAAAGVISTWSLLGYRVRQLETKASTIDDLRKALDAVDAKVENVRRDQGGRLGVVEKDTGILQGKFEGFTVGQDYERSRLRTAAHGAGGGGQA